MINIRKYFNGLLNAEDAEHLVGANEFINAENIRFGTTDDGASGYFENIEANTLLGVTLPSGNNTCIGATADEGKRYIIWFNYNDLGEHGIYLWDIPNNAGYTALLNSQTESGLNFDKHFLIHSARIVGNMVYWTDNLNPQRRINFIAGVKLNNPAYVTDVAAYSTPIKERTITIIRRPPAYPPAITKQTASPAPANNQIANGTFQFQYRYVYRDYEESVLSEPSAIANYNVAGDTYNSIKVEMPFDETIEQDVQQVELCVKFVDTQKVYVIKTWDKDLAADAAEITSHNSASTKLTYIFYNDQTGTLIDDAASVKPYDVVPVKSQSLEVAKNRLFLGNNLSGYDTPLSTSLLASAVIDSETAAVTGDWVKIVYNSGASVHYFLDLHSLGFFDIAVQPTPPPYPTTEAYGDLTYIAAGPADFGLYVNSHYSGWIGGIQYPGSSANITGAPVPPTVVGATCFKSDANYQLAVTFYDDYGRKCGVVTNDNLVVKIPDRTYDNISYVSKITWSLDNSNAVNEIPDWATEYSVSVTKCLRTRYFIGLRAKSVTYVDRDTSGNYTFATTAYAATLAGIGVNIATLIPYSMGYTFAEGDILKLYISTTVYSLAIKGQSGDYVICELQNAGTLDGTTKAFFEIYTPYKRSTEEYYYTQGFKYKITNPGTIAKNYSVVGGYVYGDVTLLKRNDGVSDYLAEAMSPNDKFYQNWFTNAGSVNLIDKIGQQYKPQNIVYSNTIIPGTKSNNLSSFDALNTTDVPIEGGYIQKLQLANKVQAEGSIMLCLCQRQTYSLYLGETQIFDQTGASFIAQSSNVISNINALAGSYGTISPESVVQYRGDVYWFDLITGCAVRYSENGLFPITDFKFKRVAKQFSKKFNTLSTATIESYGSRPYIFGGIDPYHDEYLLCVPQTEATPPKGQLTDFSPALDYPYDVYDGKGKVWVFKIKMSKWAAPQTYQTDYFITAGDMLYSFKNGSLYKHNDNAGTYNTFYGVAVKSRIMGIINEPPTGLKVARTLAIEGNQPPTFTHFRTENPRVQSSTVSTAKYVEREGVYYGAVLRDRLSPNATGTADQKMITGDPIRGVWIKFNLEFNYQTQLQFRFVTVGYSSSMGHNNIQNT